MPGSAGRSGGCRLSLGTKRTNSRANLSGEKTVPRPPFRRRSARIRDLASVFLGRVEGNASGTVTDSSGPAVPDVGMNGQKFIGWQTMTNYAQEALAHARGHDVNSLILEFHPNPEQPGRGFATLVDDLAFDESVPKVAKKGKARDDVLKLRSSISGILEQATKQNIKVYLADFEISYPRGMVKAYPSAADLRSEFAWQFLEARLDEVLTALPQAAGIVLYTDEPNDLIIYNQKNINRQAAVRRLIELYLRVCRRHSRQLIVCTFSDYLAERYDILISALRQIPPAKDLMVDNYICPSDWGFVRLLNPAIGRTGHAEFLTVDYTGEVLGQAQIPLCEAMLIHDRILAARQRGANLVGISGYVSWYGRKIFGTPSEINLDLAPTLLRNPSQDPRRPGSPMAQQTLWRACRGRTDRPLHKQL